MSDIVKKIEILFPVGAAPIVRVTDHVMQKDGSVAIETWETKPYTCGWSDVLAEMYGLDPSAFDTFNGNICANCAGPENEELLGEDDDSE